MLLLDLAQVGMSTGTSTLPLVCYAKEHHPGVEIISGGGVRDEKDVETFAREGCDALLVASALHNGRITPDSVRQWNHLATKHGE